jgi:hypothetical protein
VKFADADFETLLEEAAAFLVCLRGGQSFDVETVSPDCGKLTEKTSEEKGVGTSSFF